MSESCIPNKYLVELGTNTIIHITILFVILSLFFKFYVSGIIKNSAEAELRHLIHENVENSLTNLHKKQMAAQELMEEQTWINPVNIEIPNIPSAITDRVIKYYDRPDKTVATNNNWLFRDMFTVTGILCVLSLLIIMVSYLLCNKIDIKHMMLENIIIFTGIGAVEFLFFKFVATKYIPAPPSLMLTSMIDNLGQTLGN